MNEEIKETVEDVVDTPSTETETTTKTEDVKEEKTFTQTELNEIVAKRLKKQADKFENEKQEAAKLAKMNAEQKAAYESEKRENELKAREQAVQTKEMRYTAISILEENKLPVGLIECVNLADAEACNKSIESIKTAWVECLTKAVDDRLRSNDIPTFSSGNKQNDPFLAAFGN